MYFLRETGKFSGFEKKLHMLNPKQVKKFKDSYSDLPKNDFVDAFIIADHLRFGRINKEVYMGDYRYEALKALTRARHQTVQSLTREKQRFLNQLFLKFSGFTQDKIFSNKFGAASTAILEEFESVDELAYMDADELAAFIQKHGKGKFDNVDGIVSDLQKAAENSYRPPNGHCGFCKSDTRYFHVNHPSFAGADQGVRQSNRKAILHYPEYTYFCKRHRSGLCRRHHCQSRRRQPISLTGFSCQICRSYLDAASVRTFEADDTHLIKSGNHHLRYCFCEAANSLRKCDPEFRRFYNLKFREVTKHQHRQRTIRAAGTRSYCSQTGQVGLRSAENQPPLYPTGGVISGTSHALSKNF